MRNTTKKQQTSYPQRSNGGNFEPFSAVSSHFHTDTVVNTLSPLNSVFYLVLRSILLSTENTPAAESRCGGVKLGAGLSIAPAQHQSAGSAKYKGLEDDT